MCFTFTKEERLYGHIALDNVYNNGKHLQIDSVKIIYLEVPKGDFPPCRIVFSVPKRAFKKAVERNLLKRRMREIYRLEKHLLYNHPNEKEKKIHIYMIYVSKTIIPFDELKDGILKALKTLVNRLN